MANINSLTSNSYGNSYNLYGNRNVLTGLASGMDTEAMIQNSISGYLMKISSLQQSQTKIQWKQDAYRNIIDQMNSILQKYTSYTSKTNLSSNSFFTSNVKTEAVGKHASAITATGRATSDIRINSVKQLATAARYTVDSSALSVKAASEAVGKSIDWGAQNKVGQVNGSIMLKYGNQNIELTFDESDTDIDTPQGLMDAITRKLSNVTIQAKDGSNVKASSLISVSTTNGKDFSFEIADKNSSDYDGSAVYINGIYGNVGEKLGAKKPVSSEMADKVKNNSFTVPGSVSDLVKTPNMAEYLNGKSVEVTLDGVTKTVKIGDITSRLSGAAKENFDRHTAKISSLTEALAEKEKSFGEISKNYTRLTKEVAELEAKLEDESLTPEEISELRSKLDAAQERFDEAKEEYDAANNDLTAASRELEGAKQTMMDEVGSDLNKALQEDLQESINKAFGTGKVTVSVSEETGGLRFDVTADSGSTLKVTSSAGEALGIGKGVSNYFNTSNTLADLLKTDDMSGVEWLNQNARIAAAAGDIRPKGEGDDVKYYDAEGNRVAQDGDSWYRVDENGKFLYSMEINGKRVGQFTEDTALESVLTAINSDPDVGMKVSYSNLTSQFVFTMNETGSGGQIHFDNALAQRLFCVAGSSGDIAKDAKDAADRDGEDAHVTFTAGQDAIIEATVNGKDLTLTRSSNVIGMDGLTVTLHKEFEAEDGEGVTFKTSSEADTIVDTIKSFVEDINALMKTVYESYSTMPLKKSTSSKSSAGYDPLTEDDKKDMSESAITAYEEKAKTGLLFGDSDLSQLYSKLLSAIQASGVDRMDMEAIGLTTTYSNGVTQLSLDEDKLRAALDSDPDKVRNVFAKTVEGGAKTNGLMATLKTTLNSYGSTSLGSPGILVSKAGTKLSAISLMNNNLQKEYDNLEKQIEQWQSRMSDKVDYYTRQFTQLEKMMSMMNNQSSMLAGLMGY